MGRLLIPLFLCVEGILHDPLLYLSLYLKTFRQEYYDLLQSVRLSGDWEKWIAFFLEGVNITACEAVETAQEIIRPYESDRELLTGLGRLSGFVFVVHQHLFKKQIVTPMNTANEIEITFPAAQSALKRLDTAGIAREVTGKRRNKVFIYEKSLEILNRGLGKT